MLLKTYTFLSDKFLICSDNTVFSWRQSLRLSVSYGISKKSRYMPRYVCLVLCQSVESSPWQLIVTSHCCNACLLPTISYSQCLFVDLVTVTTFKTLGYLQHSRLRSCYESFDFHNNLFSRTLQYCRICFHSHTNSFVCHKR